MMSSATKQMRVMIMAGGTGGHVFPALAVAKALAEEGCVIEWLGTERGIEATLVPQNDIKLHFLDITGVRGKNLQTLVMAPFRIIGSILAARRILKEFNPDIVVGLGGYAAGPGGVAAWLLRKPLVIHEQNARPGTTNKLLSRFAAKVLTGFPNVFPKGEFVGNPVRQAICEIQKVISSEGQALRVLVMGGSLGAVALNEIVPEALSKMKNLSKVSIYHQSGRNKRDATVERYKTLNVDATTEEFIDDMAERLAWADIVICRSGALTVAELSNVGLASILIPFPYAIDDHQTENARWLVDAGAAILMPQATLNAEALAQKLDALVEAPEKVKAMATAAKQIAKPDATERFKAICLEVANV